MNAAWQLLGIAPTSDLRAVKRAYAAKLKVTSPERDPTGYMQLRDAYEAAKIYAEQQRFAEEIEASQGAPEGNDTAADVRSEPVPEVEPPPTPQQQAFEELRALLEGRKLDAALQKIEAIQNAQLFASLDDQQDFIGMVALLVHHFEIADQPWRGKLAALLGARDHDNIFPQDSRYWFPYHALLESYAELRDAAARGQARNQDEYASTPGYLHVFHVLTAPFDSERLTALTRSQTYHRLAEAILERAKTDPAVVIPRENREWWERTAMAGQHRPAAQPVAANQAPAESSGSFPLWILWPMIVLLISGLRTCGGTGTSTTHFDREEMRRLTERLQTQREMSGDAPMLLPDLLILRRIEACDPSTRTLVNLRLVDLREQYKSAHVGEPPAALSQLQDDPQLASLLAKCPNPLGR